MDQGQLNALLAATAVEELQSLSGQLDNAVMSLESIEEAMRLRGGSEAAPDFESLSLPLKRTLSLLNEHLATRAPAAPETTTGLPAESVPAAGVVSDVIRNRQDATRALDAVADFFRTHEPSSPIPLLLERAKRLVAKNFLEVLEELAPEALAPAKAASGVRDSE
jgi:type VI secretion system protein ImpA